MQNRLAEHRRARTPFRESRPWVSAARVKAKIIITPKATVLDPQGKTVQSALERLGYSGIREVHVGKYIEIDIAPGHDQESIRQALDDASRRLLSNALIEDYRIEMVD